jgi:hypothetical protein
MRTKSAHHIHFGPAIPVVPVRDFSRLPFTREEMAEVWKVCGPSVEQNLRKGLEMWQIITAAYIEGISHGSAIERANDPIKQYKEVPHVKSRSQNA